MTIFYALLICVAVLVDLASLGLAVRRHRIGHGPSGLPIVSAVVYLYVFGYTEGAFGLGSWARAGAAIVLLTLHYLCHFGPLHWVLGPSDSMKQ